MNLHHTKASLSTTRTFPPSSKTNGRKKQMTSLIVRCKINRSPRQTANRKSLAVVPTVRLINSIIQKLQRRCHLHVLDLLPTDRIPEPVVRIRYFRHSFEAFSALNNLQLERQDYLGTTTLKSLKDEVVCLSRYPNIYRERIIKTTSKYSVLGQTQGPGTCKRDEKVTKISTLTFGIRMRKLRKLYKIMIQKFL